MSLLSSMCKKRHYLFSAFSFLFSSFLFLLSTSSFSSTVVEPQKKCILGYTLNEAETECVLKVQLLANKICDSGFEYNLDRDECVKRAVVKGGFSTTCINGNLNANNECIIVSTAGVIEYCPQGYEINPPNNNCIKINSARSLAVPECEDGVLSGDVCVDFDVTVPAISCPVGSDPVEGSNVCRTEVYDSTTPSQSCPSGEYKTNGECFVRSVVNAQSSCDTTSQTYNHQTRKCEESGYITDTPLSLCQGDMEEGEDGCIKSDFIKATPLCLDGFFYDLASDQCKSPFSDLVAALGSCESVNLEARIEAFDKGEIDSIEDDYYKVYVYDLERRLCVFHNESENLECPDTYEYDLELKTCVHKDEREVQVNCPVGYAYDGDICAKMNYADLSCPKGEYQSNVSEKYCLEHKVKPSSNECPDEYSARGGECFSNDTHAPKCSALFEYSSAHKKCVPKGNYPARKHCPAGFFLNGDDCSNLYYKTNECSEGFSENTEDINCTFEESFTPVAVCPEGEDIGTGCETKEYLAPYCPDNIYTPSGTPVLYEYSYETEACETDHYIVATEDCENTYTGEYNDENIRTKKKEEPFNGLCQVNVYEQKRFESSVLIDTFSGPMRYKCPEGYRHPYLSESGNEDYWDGYEDNTDDGLDPLIDYDVTSNICLLDVLSAVDVCFAGWTLEEHQCVKKVVKDYLYECTEDGVSIDDFEMCVGGDVKALNCPLGYAYSEEMLRCEKILKSNMLYECPYGFKYDASVEQCVPDNDISEPPVCIDELFTFEPESNVCAAKTELPSCPDTYTYSNERDECVLTEEKDASSSCGPGFYDDGGGCREMETLDCPEGYSFDDEQNKCTEAQSIAAIQDECDEGFADVSSGCRKLSLPLCNTGFDFIEALGQCVKSEVISATKSCENGYHQSTLGCHVTTAPTCLGIDYSFNTATKQCEKIDNVASTKVCSTGLYDAGSGCKDQHEPSCPENHTLNTETELCEEIDIIPAEEVCDSGEHKSTNGCHETAIPSCDNGYTPNLISGKCEKNDLVDKTNVCGDGYYDDGEGCRLTEIATCDGSHMLDEIVDMCSLVENKPAGQGCTGGRIISGGACMDRHTPNCPGGYNYSNNDDLCVDVDVSIPHYSCSAGSVSGSQCYIPATSSPSCNDNSYSYSDSEKECIKTINSPPNFSCSEGILEGESCENVTTNTEFCPSDYSFNDITKKCEKESFTGATCPSSSYVLTGSDCVLTTTETQSGICPYMEGRELSGNGSVSVSKPLGMSLVNGDWYCKYGGFSNFSSTFPSTSSNTRHENYGDSGFIFDFIITGNGFGYVLTGGANATAPGLPYDGYAEPSCPNGYGFDFDTGLCTKTTTTIATATCIGGELIGAQCRSVSETTPICKNTGFTFVGDVCQLTTTTDADITCPNGTTFNESSQMCEGTQKEDAHCAQGAFDSVSGLCKFTDKTDATASCDGEWFWSGSQCKRVRTSNSVSCSDGYTWVGDWCNQDVKTPLEFICESGWDLIGNTCYKTHLNTFPNCSDGYTYNKSANKCISNSSVGYSNGCPHGGVFNVELNKCDVTLVDGDACNSGFSYVSGASECRATIHSSFNFVCPDNTYTLSGSNCEKVLTEAPTCFGEYTYDSDADMCLSNTSVSHLDECPDNYTYSPVKKACVTTLIGSTFCPDGYNPYQTGNIDCINTSTVTFTLSCPDDNPPWTLQGSQCERDLNHVPNCETGSTFHGPSNTCRSDDLTLYTYQCPVATPAWTLDGTACNRVDLEAPLCSDGFTYHTGNKRCENDATEGYNYSCESDIVNPWSVIDDKCVRDLVTAEACAHGSNINYSDDVCRYQTSIERTPICDELGYVLTVDQKCVKDEISSVECGSFDFAPPLDRCALKDEALPIFKCMDGWEIEDDKCVKYTLAENIPTCDDTHNFIRENNTCVAHDEKPAEMICPSTGFYKLQSDGVMCRNVGANVSEIIGYSCPSGDFELDGDKCVAKSTEEKTYFCESSLFELYKDGDTIICRKPEIIFSDVTYSCDSEEGYDSFAPGFCEKYTTTDPIQSCFPPFTLSEDESQCEYVYDREVDALVFCPEGYAEYAGGLCAIKNETPVTYSCSQDNQYLVGSFCYTDINVEIPFLVGCPTSVVDGICSTVVTEKPVIACSDHEMAYIPLINECAKLEVIETHVPNQPCELDFEFAILDGAAICQYEQSASYIAWCPDGVLSGGVCVDLLEDTLPSVCPKGSLFRFGRCYEKIQDNKIDKCPESYITELDGSCSFAELSVEAPVVTCDPGFVLQGIECVKRKVEDAVESCVDSDKSVINGSCALTKVTEDSPFDDCPDGFDNTGFGCKAQLVEVADISCDDGYIYSGGECQLIQSKTTKPIYTCSDPSYELDFTSGLCVKTLESKEIDFTCSVGEESGDKCKITTYDEKLYGRCAINDTISEPSLKYVVEKDKYGKSHCIQRTFMPPKTTCPIGSSEVGGMCIYDNPGETVPYILNCPDT